MYHQVLDMAPVVQYSQVEVSWSPRENPADWVFMGCLLV